MEKKYSLLIDLLENENIEYKKNASLKDYCTFRIGGRADVIVEPKSNEEVGLVIKLLEQNSIKYLVLGRGSNILFSDDGFAGIIIHLGQNLSKIELLEENIVFAQSGALLKEMCLFALKHKLTGMEELYGIPGSVGGALFMNAGAYGGEIKNVAEYSNHVTIDGKIDNFRKDQLNLSYRHSIYTDDHYIITGLAVKLEKGDYQAIKAEMADFMGRRVSKQPLELPSAGSTFKRPEGHYASALIDECGLKGYSYGGAGVSAKHAGFVINHDNANYNDVMQVINHVKKVVLDKTNIELECEIIIVDSLFQQTLKGAL